MTQSNAIQQVFNPATQRTLIRIGLFLVIGLVLVLAVVLSIRLFKKSTTGAPPHNGTNTGGNDTPPVNNDGTPATIGENLKRLAEDLKQASSWSFLCNTLRCDTILSMAELPDQQLLQMGAYFKSLYGSTLRETFDSFYVSGCCFRDADNVVDAKLKGIQERVRKLNI